MRMNLRNYRTIVHHEAYVHFTIDETQFQILKNNNPLRFLPLGLGANSTSGKVFALHAAHLSSIPGSWATHKVPLVIQAVAPEQRARSNA